MGSRLFMSVFDVCSLSIPISLRYVNLLLTTLLGLAWLFRICYGVSVTGIERLPCSLVAVITELDC